MTGTDIVGREREIASVSAKLATTRLVMITGLGGIGKTRLAVEVAGRQAREGQWTRFVDLSSSSTQAGAIFAIARTLDVRETSGRDLEAAVSAYLAEPPDRLLVLDNLEQLVSAGELVTRLLDAAHSLRIVGTSRVPLRVPGEEELPIGALELPSGDTPEAVIASPAGALFLDRARSLGRLHELSSVDARDVGRLCRRVDGLPLALELAAARVRLMSVAAMVHRLDTGRRVFGTGDPAGRRSLESVLTWTIGLLTPSQQQVLMSLSVCVGGFDLELAEALSPDTDVVDAVDALVDLGLVKVLPDIAGEPRFGLLETVRASCLARLSPAQRDAVERRRAAHVLASVEALSRQLVGVDADSARQRLDADTGNIRAVVDWSEQFQPELGLAILWALRHYTIDRGNLRASAAQISRLLELAGPSSGARARGLISLAMIQQLLVGNARGAAIATEALDQAQAIGDVPAEVDALTILVLGELSTGNAAAIEAYAGQLLEIAARSPDPGAAPNAVWALGVAAVINGDRRAFDHMRHAAELDRGRGDELAVAQDLAVASLAALLLDEPRLALTYAEEALGIAVAVGNVVAQNQSLELKAAAAAELGLRGVAVDAFIACLRGVEAFGPSAHLAEAMRYGMPLALIEDRSDLAGRLWGAAEALQESLGEAANELDRRLGDRYVRRIRHELGPVRFDVAVRTGRTASPQALLEELEAVVSRPPRHTAQQARPRLLHGELTARETEVLWLVGEGRSDTEIAAALGISPKTAAVHISNAKEKLGASSRFDLALRARALLPADRP